MPRLLDLFCGAGGCAAGYVRAGFEVVGVDLAPQPHFPYEFIEADALTIDIEWARQFDAVHASPPCQRWSKATLQHGRQHAEEHPDLITPTRELLQAIGRHYVIENVPHTPLRDYVVLCGVSFPELKVIRHRWFETTFPVMVPPHQKHPPIRWPWSRRDRQRAPNAEYLSVAGGGNYVAADGRKAMGIPWMTRDELSQAIPPAYTEYIGGYLRRALEQGQP